MAFFDVVFKFFWDSISGIAFLSELLIDMLKNIPEYLTFFPTTVSGVIIVGIVVAILFQILGR